jgi:hypothetical protein
VTTGAVPPAATTREDADVVIASPGDLETALDSLARRHRMVFFAGLPGVGKSLFIRELARVAHGMGRTVHSLQWDVARPAFLSPAILARFPERDGVAHPIVRKGVGRWVRQAVLRWHREHERSASMLIGEVPLIGHRLVELVQVHADDAEPLLADAKTLFATPVPSVQVRAAIARARTFANPTNPRESADADIDIVQASWAEIHALAVDLGAAASIAAGRPPFDPRAYAAVYRHLLRRRNALTVHVDVELAQAASVYDHAVEVTDIVPTEAEADSIVARLEREHTETEIEAEVARWARSI